MKFEDKLIELRKKSGLSQEQLAEKLDVTRQTISKWELGQSKPDMDKLTMMSKLYDVNIDELIDESKKEISKKEKKVNYNNRKFILYIVIFLFVFCIAFLGYRILSNKEKDEDNKKSSIFSIFSIFDDFENMDVVSKFSTTSFNLQFENNKGEKSAFFLESILSNLITSNSKNADHQIELVVDGQNLGNSIEQIKEFKQNLDDDNKYDVSYEYDSEGFIYKMNIDTIEEDVSVYSFNFQFEPHAGTSSGFFMEDYMTNLITSNKKYTKHQVELIFDGESYGTDTEAITNKKYKLKDNTEYDLSFEYDEKGYINKFIVVTK